MVRVPPQHSADVVPLRGAEPPPQRAAARARPSVEGAEFGAGLRTDAVG
jgi:hypothetical protein